MAKHVQGSAVTNATSYKLYKLVSEEYTELATQNTGGAIDFDLSELTLADGTYTLAVKAFDSTGTYADSDYSNTVSYTVAEDPVTPTNYTFTINPDPTSATVTLSATGYSTVSGTGSNSITVANGTVVSWSVSANGYTEQNGTWTVNGENKTENITLTASGGDITNPSESTMAKHLGYSINATNGELQQTSATLTFKVVSDYVEIPSGAYISEIYAIADSSQGSHPGPNAYCAFYDSNKQFISAIQAQESDPASTGTWRKMTTPPTIPSGANYIRVAFNSTYGEQSGATLKFAR